VGGHVASQLLEAGHTIRAIVRPGRAERIRSTFPRAGSKLEPFELASLEASDYTEAFKGIDAVVHVASPAFFKGMSSYKLIREFELKSCCYTIGETNKEVFEVSL